MKKVYIPTQEELKQLQSYNINIYDYLLSKLVELLIILDVIYEEADMLDIAYTEFAESDEIPYSICRMYPERISSSIDAANDLNLCIKLTTHLKRTDKSIYALDNLSFFNQESSMFKDQELIKNTIKFLAPRLQECPQYRFNYQGPNILLDDLFACNLEEDQINLDNLEELLILDPIYITKIKKDKLKTKSNQEINQMLKRGLLKYSDRFGLGELNRELFQPIPPEVRQEIIKKILNLFEEYRNFFKNSELFYETMTRK